MPEIIQFKNGNQILNTYHAGGQKLNTRFKTLQNELLMPLNEGEICDIGETFDDYESVDYSGYDYVDNFEYLTYRFWDVADGGFVFANLLDKIYNNEGYTKFEYYPQQSINYHYFRRDHLGNNREVWNASTNTTVQRTQYYPSGLPWASNSGDNPWVQNKKYNGCEFIEMHGLDVTDLGNRGVQNATNRFTSMDRFCEKFPWQSPYVHAGNNPVNYVDLMGDSIAVLNMGTGNEQHLALLVQNNEGKWQYFSLNGDWVYEITDGKVGGKPYHDLGSKTFDSPADFLKSGYNLIGNEKQIQENEVNNYGFKEAYIIPTSKEQDSKIAETFREVATNKYSLIDNQCAHAVQKSLNSAGINTIETKTKSITDIYRGYIYLGEIKSTPYLPSTAFKVIINNNPNGVHLRRRYEKR